MLATFIVVEDHRRRNWGYQVQQVLLDRVPCSHMPVRQSNGRHRSRPPQGEGQLPTKGWVSHRGHRYMNWHWNWHRYWNWHRHGYFWWNPGYILTPLSVHWCIRPSWIKKTAMFVWLWCLPFQSFASQKESIIGKLEILGIFSFSNSNEKLSKFRSLFHLNESERKKRGSETEIWQSISW